MTITAEDIHNDVIGNLGNRDDMDETRIYRMIHYSQLAIARLTRWRDFLFNNSVAHGTWTGTSMVNDSVLNIDTMYGIGIANRIRTVRALITQNVVDDEFRRLHRVATYKEWYESYPINARYGAGATRDQPTHYFLENTSITLFPVPDMVYVFTLYAIIFPVEINVTNKANALTITNAEDLVTARTTYLLALGHNMPDIARFWQAEYGSMLRDLVQAEKDPGDIDMAAFRQETNLNGRTNGWWNDPFVDGSLGSSVGDQVI